MVTLSLRPLKGDQQLAGPGNDRHPPQLVLQTGAAADDAQPRFPIRAAFYYPWYTGGPTAWARSVHRPSLGTYASGGRDITRKHILAMQHGHIGVGISSWWGRGDYTDAAFSKMLKWTVGSTFHWALYAELESVGDPSAAEIHRDLLYVRDRYGSDPAYLRIGGRFVMFVYQVEDCEAAMRWVKANEGVDAWLDFTLFPGWEDCAAKPDAWHAYSPDNPVTAQGQTAFEISPGWVMQGQQPKLERDLDRWRANVRDMIASNANFQLVETFNEWWEGTAVESAAGWESPSGFGAYIDVLHDESAASGEEPLQAPSWSAADLTPEPPPPPPPPVAAPSGPYAPAAAPAAPSSAPTAPPASASPESAPAAPAPSTDSAAENERMKKEREALLQAARDQAEARRREREQRQKDRQQPAPAPAPPADPPAESTPPPGP
jgi:hypothetical protein